eukprot:1233045-Alexandrium_andersonii.AAC.1
MSASLVGSEMCIRDSPQWRSDHRRPQTRKAHVRGKGTRARTSERRLQPVSYTHLTLPTICSV